MIIHTAIRLLSVFVFFFISIFFLVQTPGIQALQSLLLDSQVGALLSPFSATYVLGLCVVLGITLVWGRVYCGYFCPMGVLQDAARYLGIKLFKRSHRVQAPPRFRVLPWIILLLSALSVSVGFGLLWAFFEPYSSYGSLLSVIRIQLDSVWLYAWLLWPLVPVVFSAIYPRVYCRLLCPVGALLSVLAHVSGFRLKFKKTSCRRCKRCQAVCPMACIDVDKGSIQARDCVVCMKCTKCCPDQAIGYVWHYKRRAAGADKIVSLERRDFLKNTLLYSSQCAAGLALICAPHHRSVRSSEPDLANGPNIALPPFVRDFGDFSRNCIRCQACVVACPSQILKPRSQLVPLDAFLLPMRDLSKGSCAAGCKTCAQTCPTGAISWALPETTNSPKPETTDSPQIEQSQNTNPSREPKPRKIAVWSAQHCFAALDGGCLHCAQVCAFGAIELVDDATTGYVIPKIIADKCVGCQKCVRACPSEPKSLSMQEFGQLAPLPLWGKSPPRRNPLFHAGLRLPPLRGFNRQPRNAPLVGLALRR